MAKSSPKLIEALRKTADRLDNGARYEWGHMARCNCGHLVQTITDLSDKDISKAVEFQLDEWTEYAKDVCENSGTKADNLFLAMRDIGFYYDDVIKLENLSDHNVLAKMQNRESIRKNNPEDVSEYMKTLASILEDELEPELV